MLGDLGEVSRRLRRALFCVYVSRSAFDNLQKLWNHHLSTAAGTRNETLHLEIGETLRDVIRAAEKEEDMYGKGNDKQGTCVFMFNVPITALSKTRSCGCVCARVW